MAQLGFIGLGIMGKPMARHLIAAGHTVHVYNRSRKAVEELSAKGARACSTCREAAEQAEVVFIMVPDTPDVEQVIFGETGAIEGLKPGSVVVDMSTISPIATRDFAARLAEKGVAMLDAPVSGGQVGAEQATLSIMVGGPAETFERVKPLLGVMGKRVIHIGGNGDGQTCKAANQIVVAVTIEAISEALLFASRAGADPAKVREALLGGFAQSRILELHGQRIIQRNFEPGFRVNLQQKDLNIVLQTARSLRMSLPGTAVAQEMLNSVENGLDHSALVLALEKLAGHQVAEG